MLESGLANDVVGESAADSSPDCKPDPVALQKTQDLLQVGHGGVGRPGLDRVGQGDKKKEARDHCCRCQCSLLPRQVRTLVSSTFTHLPLGVYAQKCKGEAQGAGIKNVKMTTLVSCVGGSADMVSSPPRLLGLLCPGQQWTQWLAHHTHAAVL